MARRQRTAAAVLVSAAALIGCTSNSTKPESQAERVEVSPTMAEEGAGHSSSTREPSSPADNGINPLGGNSPEDSRMPNVLCMNLQEAQDEIQDHGVFFSRSEDAAGDGRMQLNDSNWQVVALSPPTPAAPSERAMPLCSS